MDFLLLLISQISENHPTSSSFRTEFNGLTRKNMTNLTNGPATSGYHQLISGKHPIIYRVLTIPFGGAGFLSPTVLHIY